MFNTEVFIDRGRKIYNNHNYEKTVYKNCREKVTIICPSHGEFEQIPYKYLQGRGCQKCGLQKQTQGHRTPKLGFSLLDKFPKICEQWSDSNTYSPDKYKPSSRSKVKWRCDKCHEEWIQSINVRTSLKCGCPNCISSRGESKIEKFLKEKKIQYKKQYTIKECRDKRVLRFDFAIWIKNSLMLLEYNGRQHYDKTSKFNNIDTQNKDKIKINFCQQNNIKLIIIPYTEYSNIESILQKVLDE